MNLNGNSYSHRIIIHVFLFSMVFIVGPIGCKSIQRGGEQKAVEITQKLDEAEDDLEEAEEEVMKSSATPEEKRAAVSKIQSAKSKIDAQKQPIIDVGRGSDVNAEIADKLKIQNEALAKDLWILLGIITAMGMGFCAIGLIRGALWAKILGGSLMAISIAFGLKKVFF